MIVLEILITNVDWNKFDFFFVSKNKKSRKSVLLELNSKKFADKTLIKVSSKLKPIKKYLFHGF